MKYENKENHPVYVLVGKEMVFTADFVFKQMQAQESRIDRAQWIAKLALAVSCISLILNLIQLLC
mgnify:CR=1 FL=1|jgi:hypothetical protein